MVFAHREKETQEKETQEAFFLYLSGVICVLERRGNIKYLLSNT